ncbi:E3 ubiquitin-protein ligase rad18, partial [Coemansia helicoidea]
MLECALDDPSDWPREHAGLRDMDQLLRCAVCKEYFTTAMTAAGCGHTFCSLCVRRCLTQETKCPTCRAPLTESELHPNRLVDSLLRAFVS